MKFNLPTRDEAKLISKNNNAFILTERTIEGQKVEIYDYRLASISDFVDYEAFELRGLTFVLNSDGIWERNILLNKFFNVNQTVGWMLNDVKDKKIVRVQNKEDGSIISFVKFENGVIRAKSKTSFESDQAVMAQNIFDNNEKLSLFVSEMIKYGNTPIFELVSPDNQIVLEYQETNLILLQIRLRDGTYLPVGNEWNYLVKKFDLTVAEDFDNLTLDELLSLKETCQEDIEGWVVTFEDGQMAKIKTNKYLSLHGLIGPDAFRENLLIETILNGDIDDVISALNEGVKKDNIIELDKKVTHFFNYLVEDFLYLRNLYFTEFDSDRKKFAQAFSKSNPLFGYVIKTVSLQNIEDLEKVAEKSIKTFILKQTNSLSKAKEWINSLN